MNKTRQYVIIGFVILLIGSFVITPFFRSKPGLDESSQGARFKFNQNLGVVYGKTVPLSIDAGKDLVQVDLFFQDSLLKSWSNPSGTLNYVLNSGSFGLGAKSITLISRDKSGASYDDQRLVRVLSDIEPSKLQASVVKSFTHNSTSFTQGLEFSDGQLYESTGQKGQSFIAKVKLESGAIENKIGLDANYFGEGITILNDKIYQLTWQENKCFVYDKNSLQLRSDYTYTGEGWGICNDGKSLIMSNGTETITFRDPDNFQIQRTIEVYDQGGPIIRLNELEYIDGKIYANVWQADAIVVIDPATGKVLSIIDCTAVAAAGRGSGEVLNGIAYNPATKKMYLTGKNWSNLLEVSIK